MMTTRRSPGEGTEITRGSDGRYHAWLSMGMKTGGRRDRRHVSGRTRSEVARKLRDLQAKRDAGVVLDAGRSPTAAAWLAHFVETVAAPRLRPSTLERYRLATRQLDPYLLHHRLDRLQPEQVESVYRELGTTLAPASVLYCHRVLSRALKVAVQRGRVARNVCTLVDTPSLPRNEIRPLTTAGARAVLDAASADRHAARWSVALALGRRQGEALGLAWDDLDLEGGTLTVRRALQRQLGRGLVLVEPKSRAGHRTISLPPQLVDALCAHRAGQAAERLRAGNVWEAHGLVFAQPNGRPVDPRADHRAWKNLLAASGVPDARLHDARHTAATLLLSQGVPARVAMEILGHSQISLTLQTYSHVTAELHRDAADKVGEALWG
jgi:integrase